MKTLILGLGNPILKDDAVGLVVSRTLYEMMVNVRDIDLYEAAVTGFKILDIIAGYKKLIIIDAIITKEGRVGDFYRLEINDVKMSSRLRSPHDISFLQAIEIGKKLNMPIPEEIIIYAIEVNDPYTFGEGLTKELEEKILEITLEIFKEEFGYA